MSGASGGITATIHPSIILTAAPVMGCGGAGVNPSSHSVRGTPWTCHWRLWTVGAPGWSSENMPTGGSRPLLQRGNCANHYTSILPITGTIKPNKTQTGSQLNQQPRTSSHWQKTRILPNVVAVSSTNYISYVQLWCENWIGCCNTGVCALLNVQDVQY